MKTVNKIEANVLANNALLARNIIETEQNGDNLITISKNMNRIAKNTNNLQLAV